MLVSQLNEVLEVRVSGTPYLVQLKEVVAGRDHTAAAIATSHRLVAVWGGDAAEKDPLSCHALPLVRTD